MIDYVLLGEFDDLKGRVFRYAYPNPLPEYEPNDPGSNFEDSLCNMLVPETGPNRMVDSVFFVYNKPSFKELSA